MTRYGTPYRGSKSKIARWVVDSLPASDTLVDLFAGGCAVTHAAMESGKWAHFVANDLTDTPAIFKAAIEGEFDGYATVPDRDWFNEEKRDDRALALLYSFGNNATDYLWGGTAEVKLHASRMLSAPSLYERRREYREFMRALRRHGAMPDDERHDGSLQGLEGLERLQGLQGLVVTRLDYRDVPVPHGATVYADPPYRMTITEGYANGAEFDFAAFDAWLAEVPFPVVVSEYTCPEGCVVLARKAKRQTMNGKGSGAVKQELLCTQERFETMMRERMML